MEKSFECKICGQENMLEIEEIPVGKCLGAWCCKCGRVNEFPELTKDNTDLSENDNFLVCIAVEPKNKYVQGVQISGDTIRWQDGSGKLLSREEFAANNCIDPLVIWCMTRPRHHLCKLFDKRCSGRVTSKLLILDE